ncbi:ABC transporter permease [Ponticaulis sp.]|uniref:ABC transporter permease n=1 Tax=Ponticaulis sp. TaxID=2020902 RepID=UPI0025CF579B|nr:ABC transporter permease [Ponticaulis sp.]
MSAFSLENRDGETVLCIEGDWTVATIAPLERDLLRSVARQSANSVDVSALQAFDTAGALLVHKALTTTSETDAAPYGIQGEHAGAEALLEIVARRELSPETQPHRPKNFIDVLARIGEGAVEFCSETIETLSFIGEALLTTLKLVVQPHKIRWTSVVAIMEEAGLEALPIVSFLSFFVGMVIAFIGATMLQQTLGATVFTVELVGWAMMREFGVVLTGILLAGRTNSSFTAQIGSMKMRQEVDAMQTLGIDPIEALVTPRILAMMVMTPLLTFAATLSGMLGGLMISWVALDISPILFITRIQDIVVIQNFWVGLSKAPIFAMIVALIACRQGLQVRGDVQSLGRATTASVVHAIFLIIVADALFAMMYMELGI